MEEIKDGLISASRDKCPIQLSSSSDKIYFHISSPGKGEERLWHLVFNMKPLSFFVAARPFHMNIFKDLKVTVYKGAFLAKKRSKQSLSLVLLCIQTGNPDGSPVKARVSSSMECEGFFFCLLLEGYLQ